MSAAAMCYGSWRLLCVRFGMFAVCRRLRINHFFPNSLDLSAPEEAYSRTVRTSGTLKFGYEVVLRLYTLRLRVHYMILI